MKLNLSNWMTAQSHLSRLGYEIDIYKLNHKVTCFGYTISIPRMGKFDVEKANSLGIPKMFWNKLQHGEDVVVDGVEIKSESVMGNPRKGIKVTYCTDTRPVQAIIEQCLPVLIYLSAKVCMVLMTIK